MKINLGIVFLTLLSTASYAGTLSCVDSSGRLKLSRYHYSGGPPPEVGMLVGSARLQQRGDVIGLTLHFHEEPTKRVLEFSAKEVGLKTVLQSGGSPQDGFEVYAKKVALTFFLNLGLVGYSIC